MGLKIPNGERTGLWWQLKVRERLSWVYNHTVRECINRRVYTLLVTMAMLERSIRNTGGGEKVLSAYHIPQKQSAANLFCMHFLFFAE